MSDTAARSDLSRVEEGIARGAAWRHVASVNFCTLELADLEQEARIAIWRAREKRDPARAEAEWHGYLRKRAEGAVLDAIEKAQRREISTSEPLHDGEDELPRVELRADPCTAATRIGVAQALARLKPRDRMVAELLRRGQLGTEIAESFGVPDWTIAQARNRLREHFERFVEA